MMFIVFASLGALWRILDGSGWWLPGGHAATVARTEPGDRVILLNADLVVSGNLLERCAEHADAGVEAVVLLGIRTAAGPEKPPVNAAPRDLLAWAWAHRHQIIQDLEWPHGTSMLPTNLFWEGNGSVVARGLWRSGNRERDTG